MAERRSPWLYVPSQYFAEGLPYVIVNTFSVAMYSSMGVSNELIGLTSFLYLPWTLKPLWAPLVDGIATKRSWLLAMQAAIGAILIFSGFFVNTPYFFVATLIAFSLTAFLSATHDIATDGYYLFALDKGQQAFFSGIRSTFYRLSMIFGSGILVIIAGNISSDEANTSTGWAAGLSVGGIIFVALLAYHYFILPRPKGDEAVLGDVNKFPFIKAFASYFKQAKIIPIILFILTYRLGEGILVKMLQPFLNKTDGGALGIPIENVGFMYGTIGVASLVIGGILGGWLIKLFGLKKLFIPLALCMNIPNLLYVYLAHFKPLDSFKLNLGMISEGLQFEIFGTIQLFIAVEQFGYGIGFTAFMVYLLYLAKGEFKTSHYAISTGFMALGMMVPGLVSGWLQSILGYEMLFLVSFFATIPGFLLIFLIPKDFD